MKKIYFFTFASILGIVMLSVSYLVIQAEATTSPESIGFINLQLYKGSCPFNISAYSQTYAVAHYQCNYPGSSTTVTGKVSGKGGNCETSRELVKIAQTDCRNSNYDAADTAPYTTSTPQPTPHSASRQRCEPDSYVAGTYCTGTSSCYDIYCNSDGTKTRFAEYSGSGMCGYCANYTCEANSFIAGTYPHPDGNGDFEVYCNASGNSTTQVRR